MQDALQPCMVSLPPHPTPSILSSLPLYPVLTRIHSPSEKAAHCLSLEEHCLSSQKIPFGSITPPTYFLRPLIQSDYLLVHKSEKESLPESEQCTIFLSSLKFYFQSYQTAVRLSVLFQFLTCGSQDNLRFFYIFWIRSQKLFQE